MGKSHHKKRRATHGDSAPDGRDYYIPFEKDSGDDGHDHHVVGEGPEEIDSYEQVPFFQKTKEGHNLMQVF